MGSTFQHHFPRLLLNGKSGGNAAAAAVSYDGGGNFDGQMVIILAGLLCALICAMGLNSIVRCTLRRSRRRMMAETARGDSPDPPVLKKAEELNWIPATVYNAGEVAATECPICLGEFVDGEDVVRILPKCRHGFHVKCIDVWLGLHSSCPTCRQSLVQCGGRATAEYVTVGVN
ncbi:hypothetical protein M569_07172 [Genlisea aurea]|uniref:RING-type E3 ubiquitin transferase n=1 Tax=Genlisea aurea TaxID=192259 RepID=S8DWM5_9LAMI|nr:hypothetical protein M569_07172 [Genlisea aurea]